MKIVSFLIAFVIFSIVILFHELGLFACKGKRNPVNDFVSALDRLSVGYKKAETKYCLRLPFGGAA